VDNSHTPCHWPYRGRVMPDPSLHDEQLEREIQLVGELVLAASQSEDHLTEERIDELLGVDGDSPPAGRA
jgi:hypothetical protein